LAVGSNLYAWLLALGVYTRGRRQEHSVVGVSQQNVGFCCFCEMDVTQVLPQVLMIGGRQYLFGELDLAVKIKVFTLENRYFSAHDSIEKNSPSWKLFFHLPFK
jgi:hypothetical protein